mmetsp:Transcript_8247/g.24310  ORF Transcript_8247/g.24310 Transcript_8247/m.24310 type:complete len:393 (+) Transcript_8247:1705-2883(+)
MAASLFTSPSATSSPYKLSWFWLPLSSTGAACISMPPSSRACAAGSAKPSLLRATKSCGRKSCAETCGRGQSFSDGTPSSTVPSAQRMSTRVRDSTITAEEECESCMACTWSPIAQPSEEFGTVSGRNASGPTHSSGGWESFTTPASQRTASRQHSTEVTTPQMDVPRLGDRRPRLPRSHSAWRQSRAGALTRWPGKCGLSSCGVTSSPPAGSKPWSPSLLTWKAQTGGLCRPLLRGSRCSPLLQSSTSTLKTASSTLPTHRVASLATQSSARKPPTARTARTGTSGDGAVGPGMAANFSLQLTPATVPSDRGSSTLATRSPSTQGRSMTLTELSLVRALGHCSRPWPSQKTEQCPSGSSWSSSSVVSPSSYPATRRTWPLHCHWACRARPA